jgi:hypothetical protein
MNYKEHAIRVKDPKTGHFNAGHTVGSSLVVGAVVEAALKLAHRPSPNELPVQIALQTPHMHETVCLKDVIPPGSSRQQNCKVKVFPKDASLALDILVNFLGKLMDGPYNLEVLTVDHSNNSSCTTSHDIIMATRSVGRSCLPSGAYSVEVKCREVQSKTGFSWYDTLTSESMPLWRAELCDVSSCKRAGLKGRVLVFACMARPCHAGSTSIHAAVNYTDKQEGWQLLFGWEGFDKGEKLKRKRASSTSSSSSSPPVVAIAEAPVTQWQKLAHKLIADGDYYKLTSFCRGLRPKLNDKQATRDYIQGPNAWRLGRGGRDRRGSKLVEGTHWVRRKGHGGGIPATFVRKQDLEQVFYKYFAKK